jgi:hypothetical protein
MRELVGIVESYRTARVAIPEMKERVLEVPVAAETTLSPAAAMAGFLVGAGRLPGEVTTPGALSAPVALRRAARQFATAAAPARRPPPA